MAGNKLEPGDKVTWSTHGIRTTGEVERGFDHDAKAGGRQVRASSDHPQYVVKSDKSGREAVHKPDALDKA